MDLCTVNMNCTRKSEIVYGVDKEWSVGNVGCGMVYWEYEICYIGNCVYYGQGMVIQEWEMWSVEWCIEDMDCYRGNMK